MAVEQENIQKWEYCLNLKREADHVDPFYETVGQTLLKKVYAAKNDSNQI